MSQINTTTQSLQAIVRMVAAMASFAVMNVLIRYVSHDLPTPQIVFLRNVFAVMWLLPWVVYHGVAALKTDLISRHIWRAGVGIVSMELWFYALAIMPITDATALSFTSPLWATLMAVLFLGEKIGIHRVSALIVGFMGAMIIVRPTSALGVSLPALVVLASALLMAVASTLVKALTATDPVWRIVFFMSVFMTLFSAPLGVYVWQPMSWQQCGVIVAVAGTSVLAHLLMVSAFARASMVLLMPFDFMRLIFTAILAHFAFAEVLDIWTGVGALVIIASTCYIAWREHRASKKEIASCT